MNHKKIEKHKKKRQRSLFWPVVYVILLNFCEVQGLHVYTCVLHMHCVAHWKQMGVICHNSWVSGWWSESVSRVNADREPGPASTKTCSGEAGTVSELTREMIENARKVNWALWTSIIELKHWGEHEKIGWKGGRIARSTRWENVQRRGQRCSRE